MRGHAEVRQTGQNQQGRGNGDRIHNSQQAHRILNEQWNRPRVGNEEVQSDRRDEDGCNHKGSIEYQRAGDDPPVIATDKGDEGDDAHDEEDTGGPVEGAHPVGERTNGEDDQFQ